MLVKFAFILSTFLICSLNAMGQTVMLPTVGVFSINTSVAVPDGGTTVLGGNTNWRNFQRGRSIAQPSLVGSTGLTKSGVATSVTILDLNELEQALLDTVSAKPQPGKKRGAPPPDIIVYSSAQSDLIREAEEALARNPAPYSPPDYAYLAILSHPNDPTLTRDLVGDVRFYVDQAHAARNSQSWTSAQVMYEQAWEKLPSYMKQEVIARLAEKNALKSALGKPGIGKAKKSNGK
jgi:hypothetical protein